VVWKVCGWCGKYLDSISGAKGVKIVDGEEFCGMMSTDIVAGGDVALRGNEGTEAMQGY
jgi:hypothetical protein